jgi:hypothetical protein
LDVGGSDLALSFRAMETGDLQLLHEWLQRPHFRRWWRQRETYEISELAAPLVGPRGINEHVIDEQVVTCSGERGQGGTHGRRKSLPNRAGDDCRVLRPQETLGSAGAMLHPALVDCVPECVDAESNPRRVGLTLHSAGDRRLS